MTVDGLVVYASTFEPKTTMDRVVAAVTERGMAVLARIDHAQAATKAGMELRPTEVLIFGNPKAGTPLMQQSQTMGIDLPLRILVWQDGDGKTRLAYNAPEWLARRHGADAGNSGLLEAMNAALAAVAKSATTDERR
jgi:uncharacterized protein (DUF302 family)